ncbi:MAG: single-stranded-DNA-specific exonuclease RecJ [Acidobacteria bacterium]|nr:single-stranded-DNA-specific exonuclease RecJ [Acidobacteriota bacterium]MCI0720248.1 single-stranded-DNA-specific exonuclease RecJ [Acidobacteriota bacterium]
MLWKIATPDPNLVRGLAHTLNISGTLAILLVNRGLADALPAQEFLQARFEVLADPFLMRDLKKAVERIFLGIERQEKILIYGDYDVDGTTAVVILRKALEMLGASTTYHIPRRFVDGYGMKADVVRQAANDGVKLIISVDTGIKAFDVVETANSLGLDCIITDHHLPEDGLPRALAVLNPKRSDCSYPDKNLCGVGVAFKLIQALFRQTDKERYLLSFLKVVAIGTIADVVPLVGENRIFVKIGLKGLQVPANSGLKSLIEICGLDSRAITSSDVGFRLAPRINAVGRMGGGGQVVELFASADEEKSRSLAQEMDRLNRERQLIEEQIFRRAQERFSAEPGLARQWVIVLDGEGWHRGVIGIVATKVSEKYHRPVLVVSTENGVGYGSGRSPKGFHLLNALECCRDLFDRFGGHAQAAGFQIPTEHIDELRRRLNLHAATVVTEQDLEPSLEIDSELRLSDIDEGLFQDVEKLSPFGPANPQPLFVARDLAIIAEPRILKGKHLKFRVEQDGKALDVIGWNMAHRHPISLTAERKLSLAFTIVSAAYQGIRSLQLVVKDIKIP